MLQLIVNWLGFVNKGQDVCSYRLHARSQMIRLMLERQDRLQGTQVKDILSMMSEASLAFRLLPLSIFTSLLSASKSLTALKIELRQSTLPAAMSDQRRCPT